jgi:hypothetical protein
MNGVLFAGRPGGGRPGQSLGGASRRLHYPKRCVYYRICSSNLTLLLATIMPQDVFEISDIARPCGCVFVLCRGDGRGGYPGEGAGIL